MTFNSFEVNSVRIPKPTFVKKMAKCVIMLLFYVSLLSKHKTNTKTRPKKKREKREGFVKINIWNLYSKLLTTITKKYQIK